MYKKNTGENMAGVATTVRLPPQLRREIGTLVEEGHFKNISDFLLASAREKVKEYTPSEATLKAREAKKEIQREYLKKAKGDYKKALNLMFKDLLKEQEKEFNF